MRVGGSGSPRRRRKRSAAERRKHDCQSRFSQLPTCHLHPCLLAQPLATSNLNLVAQAYAEAKLSPLECIAHVRPNPNNELATDSMQLKSAVPPELCIKMKRLGPPETS